MTHTMMLYSCTDIGIGQGRPHASKCHKTASEGATGELK